MLYSGTYLTYGGKHLDFIRQYVKFHRRVLYRERYVRLLAKKVLNLLTFFISFVSTYIILKTNCRNIEIAYLLEFDRFPIR